VELEVVDVEVIVDDDVDVVEEVVVVVGTRLQTKEANTQFEAGWDNPWAMHDGAAPDPAAAPKKFPEKQV